MSAPFSTTPITCQGPHWVPHHGEGTQNHAFPRTRKARSSLGLKTRQENDGHWMQVSDGLF